MNITVHDFVLLFFPNSKQIPKEVADIFNAPSDDEEFVGFRDDVPMETLSSEESCDSFDSLESGKQVWVGPSKACICLEAWILVWIMFYMNMVLNWWYQLIVEHLILSFVPSRFKNLVRVPRSILLFESFLCTRFFFPSEGLTRSDPLSSPLWGRSPW